MKNLIVGTCLWPLQHPLVPQAQSPARLAGLCTKHDHDIAYLVPHPTKALDACDDSYPLYQVHSNSDYVMQSAEHRNHLEGKNENYSEIRV